MNEVGTGAGGWWDLGGVTVRPLVVSRFRLGARWAPRPLPAGRTVRSKLDAAGRIELVVRALLVRTSGGLALVDAGLGERPDDETCARLNLAEVSGSLAAALREAGVAREEVRSVVITHLHLDHAGGLGEEDRGSLQPVLPDAALYVQTRQWEAARAGAGRTRAYRQRELELAARMELRLMDGASEILPGLSVHPSEGHTPAMQVVTVRGTADTLIYPADLIPTLAQVHAGGRPETDVDPLAVTRERRTLLAAAAASRALLVLVHDPLTPACRVAQGREGPVCRR